MNVLFDEHEIRIGLKLWSTNTDLIAEAMSLYKEKIFQYIELYIIPGTYERVIHDWKSCTVPFTIHCTHFAHGFNLAKRNLRGSNKEIFHEVKVFADDLNSDVIIVHGGNDGNMDETISQIKDLWDKRILLENKPKIGLNDCLCIGWNLQEIQKIQKLGNLSGIVLDFAHAFYAANASGNNPEEFINSFFTCGPKMFHLSDGDKFSKKDKHLNLGKGDFDIRKWISKVPKGSAMTIETPMYKESGLDYFKNDIFYLNQLFQKANFNE